MYWLAWQWAQTVGLAGSLQHSMRGSKRHGRIIADRVDRRPAPWPSCGLDFMQNAAAMSCTDDSLRAEVNNINGHFFGA
jgi:hypothetical protein